MAILATFNGRNASGYWCGWGYRFPCGETVRVEGDEAMAGVKSHIEFSWEPAGLTPTEIDAAIAAFDHDGDGKPGGSKRGRRRRKTDAE